MRYLWMALLCAGAMAQPSEPPQPARVTGRTLNAKGELLRRSTVKLVGAQTYTGTSDDQGEFVFEKVAPGTYSLVASRRSYYTQKYGAKEPLIGSCATADMTETDLGSSAVAIQKQCLAKAPGSMLTLAPGEELKDLKFTLAPLASLEGRVVNQDDEAVANWRVQALRIVYQHGERTLTGTGFGAATSADGNFSLDGLAPGRYYLYALNARGNMFGGLTGERPGKPQSESDQPTFYPSAFDVSHASTVEVTAGAELHGLDIHVRRSKVYSIRGKVNAPANAEVKTQILSLAAKGGLNTWQSERSQKVNEDGTFEFRNVEPGAYVVKAGQAFANAGLPPPMFGRQSVTVAGGDVEGVIVPMIPGVEPTGTIRVEGKKPAEWPYISLESLDGENGAQAQGIDSKGAFRFPRKVAPSTYLVRISELPGFFVKSMAYGRQDALHGPLDLSGGGNGSLDIVLSANVAKITGKVTNAKGDAMPGVVVSAWARKPPAINPVHSASTDQNGNFEIGDLAPGDYLVVAMEELDPALADVPEFLAKFRDSASAVTVEEGGRATVDVKLIPRERVMAEAARMK